MGFLQILATGLIEALMIDVVGNLLRSSSISLSSPGEFSASLSLSAELTKETIVTTSVALASTEIFPRPEVRFRDFPLSSLFEMLVAKRRLLALFERLFSGADLMERPHKFYGLNGEIVNQI
ncbi:hypothetical protein KM043_010764 [Ampulex compressa]|nr:hypothetical protein KM043_010764 [Ampulex compressa]